MTSRTVSRTLPILLLLMAAAVLLILSGAITTGFVFGLIVVGVAAVLLGSMFLHEAIRGQDKARLARRGLYRGPHASGW